MAVPSARGLFRATGKTATHIAKTDAGYERTDKVEREANDFYPTPPEVTRALLAYEGDRIRQYGSVWESAAGDGAMTREIEAFGLPCIKTDLIDRGCGAQLVNFFDVQERLSDAMITNPPYCEINARDGKGRWLTHALGLGCRYVALFLNWDWPAAGGLSHILDQHPISRAYVCRWKVDFTGKGAPPQRNGWFIWDMGHSGPTELHYMDRRDARQGSLL